MTTSSTLEECGVALKEYELRPFVILPNQRTELRVKPACVLRQKWLYFKGKVMRAYQKYEKASEYFIESLIDGETFC